MQLRNRECCWHNDTELRVTVWMLVGFKSNQIGAVKFSNNFDTVKNLMCHSFFLLMLHTVEISSMNVAYCNLFPTFFDSPYSDTRCTVKRVNVRDIDALV